MTKVSPELHVSSSVPSTEHVSSVGSSHTSPGKAFESSHSAILVVPPSVVSTLMAHWFGPRHVLSATKVELTQWRSVAESTLHAYVSVVHGSPTAAIVLSQ